MSRDIPSRLLIVTDPKVPLTRIEEDGTEVDALCWLIDDRLHVHPDRMHYFEALEKR